MSKIDEVFKQLWIFAQAVENAPQGTHFKETARELVEWAQKTPRNIEAYEAAKGGQGDGRSSEKQKLACIGLGADKSYIPPKQTSREDELVGWQPIESAPKDGSRFLGYSPYALEMGTAYWVTSQSRISGYWYGLCFTLTSPTHWMPLPNPPAKTQDESNAANRRG
jgi:hypothetical protein